MILEEARRLSTLRHWDRENLLSTYRYALFRGWTITEILAVPEHLRTKEYFEHAFSYSQTARFYDANLKTLRKVQVKDRIFSDFLELSCNKILFSLVFSEDSLHIYTSLDLVSPFYFRSLIKKKKFGFGGDDIDRLYKKGLRWYSAKSGLAVDTLEDGFFLQNEGYPISLWIRHNNSDVIYEKKVSFKSLVTVSNCNNKLESLIRTMVKLSPVGSINDNASNPDTLVFNSFSDDIYDGMPNRLRLTSHKLLTNSSSYSKQLFRSHDQIRRVIKKLEIPNNATFTFSVDTLPTVEGPKLLEFNAFPRMDMPQILQGVRNPNKGKISPDWSVLYAKTVYFLLADFQTYGDKKKSEEYVLQRDKHLLEKFLNNYAGKYNKENIK